MHIVTIIEDNAITGVRYGTVEMPEYNNNIQRRLDRYNRFRNALRQKTQRTQHTKNK